MFSRKKLGIAASIICLVTVTLFLQIGVFANQTMTGDFTVEAADYDVFYDCNRDGKVDMIDIFGCILRYGSEGDPVRTSYLSVPPAAFNPTTETQSYLKTEMYLRGGGSFLAEISLPHGANVTSLTVFLRDDNPLHHVQLVLEKTHMTLGYVAMAEVNSGTSETPGLVRMADYSINEPTVDNNEIAYTLYVFLTIEDATIELHGVVIAYEYVP